MVHSDKIHGAIVHGGSEATRSSQSARKDYLFRVSLKAVILNSAEQVLVVKERGRDWWDIPGGGLEHGESVRDALARELYEEVALQGEFAYESILVEDPRYLEQHNLYQMRLTFWVKPERMQFDVGEDADEVQFIDPALLEHSKLITERKIFEYSQLVKQRQELAETGRI